MYQNMRGLKWHPFGNKPEQGLFQQAEVPAYMPGYIYNEPGPLHRSFVYAQASEALVPGLMTTSKALAGAASNLQTQCSVTVAALAGDTRLYVNAETTAQAADLFEFGLATIEDVSPTLNLYPIPIIGNSLLATTGTASYIDLAYPLPVDITTSDKVDLSVNPWAGVRSCPVTTVDGMPTGVPLINVTSGYYAWVKTWGMCSNYLKTGVMVSGVDVLIDVVAGAVLSDTAAIASSRVGYVINIGTDEHSTQVFLQITR
jgi:hypothetical protein